MPDDQTKDESLDALVRLVAELALEDEEKKTPPAVGPARPHRERLHDDGKTKSP